jgi:predicted acyltransferase
VFRGASIAAMILVNDPGDRSVTYTQLLHSPWNGFTFADTIFPAFLWIAGFASVLSLRARAGHGASRASLLGHAARRALILFACGLLLEGFPYFELEHYQLTGVLQKIAVSYFFAFSIGLVTGWRGQLLALAGLFVGYIAFMLLAAAPDCPQGAWSAACNGARRLDAPLLSGHLWLSAAGNDPDGIIGTLAGISSVLLGMLFARAFDAGSGSAGIRRLLAGGAVVAAAGLALSGWIPINKVLWTPSYTLLMAGISAVTFALVFWLVDQRGHTRAFRCFEIFGRNALAAYILSRLLVDLLKKQVAGHSIYRDVLLAFAAPPVASLLFACLNVAAVYCIVWFMYRRQIFVKL